MKKTFFLSALAIGAGILPVTFFSQVSSAAGGFGHTVFLCGTGDCQSTGYNMQGQLGNGTYTDSNLPLYINNVSNIVSVAANGSQTLFVKADGTAWSVGDNSYGQLGDSTMVTRNNPVQVYGLGSVNQAASGKFHSLFLSGSTAYACGYNGYWQLGDGTATNRIYPVPVFTGAMSIAAGEKHSIFLKTDSTVWTAGTNFSGQFGDGTSTDSPNPVQSPFLSGIKAIAAGELFSLYLKSDGTPWGSGYNFQGQLATGTTANQYTPVQVGGLTSVVAIAAGKGHSLFLRTDGTVWACGYNFYGQLGIGNTLDQLTLVQIPTLSGIVEIAAGENHSIFKKNDGTIWVCGLNTYGQFGNGTNTTQSIPVQVTNLCIPPPSAAFTTDFTNICVNGCVNFTDASTGSPTTWFWDFGDGATSTLQNPSHCYTTPGSFNTKLIVSNGGGADSAFQVIAVNATDISGIVSYSGGTLASGNALLIAQGISSAQYDTVATSPISALGVYNFTGVAPGNYYLRAEAPAYPSLVDTYFGNEYLWDSALVLSHGCSVVDSGNITMLEPPALAGSASISGTVYEGVGFGQKLIAGPLGVMANTIPGVPVKVGKNPGGAIVASSFTDASGVYNFNNLPIDNYRIYTDIPGYPMDSSYTVSITGSETVVNLDYYVDSNSVYIDLTSVSHFPSMGINTIKLFPNPTSSSVFIKHEFSEKEEVTISLADNRGRIVFSTRVKTQLKNGFALDLNFLNIESGNYFISIKSSSVNSINKLVYIKN